MIREFTTVDLDNVMKIWLDTNIFAHSFIAPSYWQGNFEYVKEIMPSANIYIYEKDNIIKGFLGLMESYIAGIFVSQDSQSKGVGKDLLDYAKLYNNNLTLLVYKNNARAVNFYLREGFTAINEQVDENTGEIEISMRWTK